MGDFRESLATYLVVAICVGAFMLWSFLVWNAGEIHGARQNWNKEIIWSTPERIASLRRAAGIADSMAMSMELLYQEVVRQDSLIEIYEYSLDHDRR